MLLFSDPSFYALHHGDADVLQPTGARTYDICAGLSLEGFVEEEGGCHGFSPKCKRLQALRVTHCSQSIRSHCVTLVIYLSPPICSFPSNSLPISPAPQGCSSPNYSFPLQNIISIFLKSHPWIFALTRSEGHFFLCPPPSLSGCRGGCSTPECALQHTSRVCLNQVGKTRIFFPGTETMQMCRCEVIVVKGTLLVFKALENEMHGQGSLKDMYAPAGGAGRCSKALLSSAQLQHGSHECGSLPRLISLLKSLANASLQLLHLRWLTALH